MSNSTNPNKLKTNSTKSASKLDRIKSRRENRGKSTATVDYDSANPDLLRSLIATVTKHGTITFGYTRDGNAYYINYWVDGESIKEYVRPTEDFDQFLRNEIEAWDV